MTPIHKSTGSQYNKNAFFRGTPEGTSHPPRGQPKNFRSKLQTDLNRGRVCPPILTDRRDRTLKPPSIPAVADRKFGVVFEQCLLRDSFCPAPRQSSFPPKSEFLRGLGQGQRVGKTSRLTFFWQAYFDEHSYRLIVCFNYNFLNAITALPAKP